MKNEQTKVVFRKFLDYNDIIAIFPEDPGNDDYDSCTTYMHIGQHGDGTLSHLRKTTVKATPEEYASLLQELNKIGYTNLLICKNITYKMQEVLNNRIHQINHRYSHGT